MNLSLVLSINVEFPSPFLILRSFLFSEVELPSPVVFLGPLTKFRRRAFCDWRMILSSLSRMMLRPLSSSDLRCIVARSSTAVRIFSARSSSTRGFFLATPTCPSAVPSVFLRLVTILSSAFISDSSLSRGDSFSHSLASHRFISSCPFRPVAFPAFPRSPRRNTSACRIFNSCATRFSSSLSL